MKFQPNRSYMLWVKRAVLAGVIAGFGTSLAAENKITAGSLSENLSTGEKFAFIAGIVEGLASARFYADNKQPDGMRCIYDWFYDGDRTQAKIQEAFDRYPNASPGQVVAVLIRAKCGG